MTTPQQTEGLKLINDWGKWLVTVETASIGVVADVFTKADSLHPLARAGCTAAILCFIFSIIVTGGLLANIPAAVTDMQDWEKIWERWIYFGNKELCQFHTAAYLLFIPFVLGILMFVTSVALLA